MTTPTTPPDGLTGLAAREAGAMPRRDFEGCSRDCRKTGVHTYEWTRCEHAEEPAPPGPVLPVSFRDTDGHMSLRFDPITWEQAEQMLRPAGESTQPRGPVEVTPALAQVADLGARLEAVTRERDEVREEVVRLTTLVGNENYGGDPWQDVPRDLVIGEALEKQAREHYRLRSDAVWEEARRIVTGMAARINEYEAAVLTVIGEEERRALVSTVVAECRKAVEVAGCICPRIDVTELSDAEPRYMPGRSPLCGVHGQGMRRD